MVNPGCAHWEAVKRVMRYLKGTKDTKLILGKGGTLTWEEVERLSRSGVKGYSNTDGNSQEHHHAISYLARFMENPGRAHWEALK